MTFRSDPDEVRYVRMRWNAPLSEDHASLLIHRLDVRPGDDVLDLGCGWGELLVRAVAGTASTTGTGVDTDERALERGRSAAMERGLSERLRFVHGDAAAWETPADRLLCVGASHAWGGTASALKALARAVKPGGRLLYGDACWERPPPTDAAAAIFGDEVHPLPELVEHATETGWTVIHLSTADQREWDDFEATWRAGRQEWLLANHAHERAPEVRRELASQLRNYIAAYRGVLGFSYLVLAR